MKTYLLSQSVPLSYKLRFYFYSLRGILRPQKFSHILPSLSNSYQFSIDDSLIEAWANLFNIPKSTGPLPFSYFWPLCVQSFHSFITQLKINYRNILHFQTEITYFQKDYFLEPHKTYTLETKLNGFYPLHKNGIVFLIMTTVLDSEKHPVVQQLESIFVKNISLPKDFIPSSIELSPPIKKPIRKSPLPHSRQTFFDPKMGIRYGLVSGDLNPIHTHKWLTKLFDYNKIFLQGMCTANFAMKTFICGENEAVRKLLISFSSPLFLGQNIQIRYNNSHFQVLDESQKIVAYGSRELFAETKNS